MKKLFFILLLITSYLLLITNARTATIDELQSQINDKNNQIDNIQKEIDTLQSQIDQSSAQANTLKNQINQLNLEKQKLQKDISLTQNQIDASKLNIQQLDMEIAQKENDIQNKLSVMTEAIKNIHETDKTSVVEIVLAVQNFSDFFANIEEINSFQKQMAADLAALKDLKTSLESEEQAQEKQKSGLEQQKSKLADQTKLVQINQNSKSQLLTQTKNQQSLYQQQLDAKKKTMEELQKEVSDYEAQLKYTLNPSALPPVGTGALKWPLANIYVTQKFGMTASSIYADSSGFHNGVDFRASVGTEVFSAGDGVIDGTGDTDTTCPGASFGKWILIKYDNGLATTYAHLSLIKVSPGQRITTGQLVAYSGDTGYTTGPHLHVSVYPKDAVNVETRPSSACSGRIYTMPIAPLNAYLDPLLYF